MYSCYKLARGIMPEKIDEERLRQRREFSDRQMKKMLNEDTVRYGFANRYVVNCELYNDRHRACGPIYRSKK